MRIRTLILLILAVFAATVAGAEQYRALVTDSTGSHNVDVDVENGYVTMVHWPNGRDTVLTGAEISSNEAQGYDPDNNVLDIYIDGYQTDSVDSSVQVDPQGS
jgi:hypothetical protein